MTTEVAEREVAVVVTDMVPVEAMVVIPPAPAVEAPPAALERRAKRSKLNATADAETLASRRLDKALRDIAIRRGIEEMHIRNDIALGDLSSHPFDIAARF